MSFFNAIKNFFGRIFGRKEAYSLPDGTGGSVNIVFEYPRSLNNTPKINDDYNNEIIGMPRREFGLPQYLEETENLRGDIHTDRKMLFLGMKSIVLDKKQLYFDDIDKILIKNNQGTLSLDKLDKEILVHINNYTCLKDLPEMFFEGDNFIALIEEIKNNAIFDAKEWNFDDNKAENFISVHDAITQFSKKETA